MNGSLERRLEALERAAAAEAPAQIVIYRVIVGEKGKRECVLVREGAGYREVEADEVNDPRD